MQRRRNRALWLVLRVALGVGGVLLGAGLVVLTVVLGRCGAFGGRCPGPAGLQGDIYGTIAAGLVLAVAAPIVAVRPDRRGVAVALAAAVPIAAVGAYALA